MLPVMASMAIIMRILSVFNNRIVSRLNTPINYTGFYMYRSTIDTMVCNRIHVTTTATAYVLQYVYANQSKCFRFYC